MKNKKRCSLIDTILKTYFSSSRSESVRTGSGWKIPENGRKVEAVIW